MESLTQLPALRVLKLWKAEKIDDRGAAHFAAMKNLASLDLSETAVTDETLAQLGPATSLRKLFLGGTKATPEAVEQFRKAHLKVEVSVANQPTANVKDPDFE
jgi:hypothetical protein